MISYGKRRYKMNLVITIRDASFKKKRRLNVNSKNSVVVRLDSVKSDCPQASSNKIDVLG